MSTATDTTPPGLGEHKKKDLTENLGKRARAKKKLKQNFKVLSKYKQIMKKTINKEHTKPLY